MTHILRQSADIVVVTLILLGSFKCFIFITFSGETAVSDNKEMRYVSPENTEIVTCEKTESHRQATSTLNKDIKHLRWLRFHSVTLTFALTAEHWILLLLVSIYRVMLKTFGFYSRLTKKNDNNLLIQRKRLTRV